MSRFAAAAAALALLLVSAPAGAGEGESTAPPPRIAIDKFLRGTVVSLDRDGVVDVRYDLKDEDQLKDFLFYRPFRVQGAWEQDLRDRKLRLKGTGGLVWKPVLKKTLEMGFHMRLGVARDAGAFIAEDRESEHYTMFSIYDQFFQNKDSPGSAKVHMICRFLPASQEFGGDLVFRYVARGARPAIPIGKPFAVAIRREGIDDEMRIDDEKLAGNEANWDPLRGLRPGFYVLDSDATYWDLRIKGRIDPEWAAAAGVDLTLPITPVGPEVPEVREAGAGDAAARARIAAFLEGTGSYRDLVRAVDDRALLEAVRREAAEALRRTATARIVPECVPLLESDDLLSRTLGDEIITALAGRSFGFKADAPEDKRRKAVKSLMEFIERYPQKFR